MAKATKNKGVSEAVLELVTPTPEPEPVDLKHIRITINGYMNITPTYSVSVISVEAKHINRDLGISSKAPAIDDDFISAHHQFVIECDINSSQELDDLISQPVILTVYESVGDIDNELLSKSAKPTKPHIQEICLLSAESAAELAEAYSGKAVDRSMFMKSESEEATTFCKSGSKQESKKSISSAGAAKEKPSEMELPTEPIILGKATLDLIPLFQGNKVMNETVLIHQPEKYYDDRVVPANIMPRIIVQVTIDEETWLPEDPNYNIFHLTVESIYNIPPLMNENMFYLTSMLLPSAFTNWEHVVIPGGKLKEQLEMERPKFWPEMSDDNSLCGATTYKIDQNTDTIKNNIEADLTVINSEKPRIEWNIIKRNYMSGDAVRQFLGKLKKHRNLPLEVYVTSIGKQEPALSPSDTGKSKGKSDVSSKSDKGKKGSEKGGSVSGRKEDYLHLMSIVEASALLYPGINKYRVVCPLNTYSQSEILEQTGQDNSYFMSASAERPPSPAKDDKKGGGKSVDKDSKKGGKGDKGDSNKNDLKVLLPPPPLPPPEPSTPIYNEMGERTFILLEIEFFKPLFPKRILKDLHDQLRCFISPHSPMPQIIMSSRLTDLYFQDIIKQLTTEIVHQHQHYLRERENCKCDRTYLGDTERIEDSQSTFRTYLQRTGVYHTYLTTITKAVSVIVRDKFYLRVEYNRNDKEYQNSIAGVYCYLIKEMNGILNELTSTGAESSPRSPLMALESLLLYAREASAIGATLLADRYYLERIARNQRNSNYWFDYAVFQLESGDNEKALECVKQCLVECGDHHYGLLLCGILLSEKKLEEEAETCFLTAILHKENWVEGWATLHLFYSQIGNEGSELCLQMASRYLNSDDNKTDYFGSVDDLAWTTTICPNTIFFRTAMLLIKMRVFTYAEKALAHEIIKHPGIYHYYLAVILYYKQDYSHALIHLKEAKTLYGVGYAVNSLTGHCFLALRKLELAKKHYLRVLESYDRPDDIHLLYMYLAAIWDISGDKQSARKLLLLACKYSPTPYTWLTAGVLYYSQNDLLSAEQCFTQANLCDNRLPEIWGYLTLVNLELNRPSEAELCYKQAKKNQMRDEELEKRIHKAMESVMKENINILTQ